MHEKKNRTVAAALALMAAIVTPAQADERAVEAARLAPGETLVLDGTLNHLAWRRAPMFDRFVEKDPVNGAAPPQRTGVQVLVDERAIWVGVTAFETEPDRMRELVVRNDQVNRTQDFVVVYIDPLGSRRSAQFFRVNAAGSLADGLHTASDDSEDFAPDFDWDAATAKTPEGWTAVLRLPFASLRYAEEGNRWRIMVARRLPREQFHLVASVPIPRGSASFIDTLQPLDGVALPEQHAFLTLRPGLTLRTESAGGVRRNEVDASLDVKWRPRAELVIDGTLNPDFSQVALDVPQLAGNSRFALFFTEKRPFFFESADLLRSPSEAFYTRSITQPRFGVRGTWRGAGLAGTALVADDRGGGLVLLPGPFGTGFAEQPASHLVAARGKLEQGAVQWGGLLAARRYERSRGENVVLGPDLVAPLSNGWRMRAQWLQSQTNAHPDAAGAMVQGSARNGSFVHLRALRNTGDSETDLLLEGSGAGFRHDTGFVTQAGVRKWSAFHAEGWTGLGPFNEFYLNTKLEQVRTNDGELVSQYLRPGLWSTAARNLEWWFEVFVPSQLRTRPGGPLLTEHFIATGLVMTPATWFPIVDVKLDVGRLADTVTDEVRRGAKLNLLAKLRPLKRLELEPSIAWAALKDEGALAYRETASQLLAVWHFDARHSLRTIVQRLALDRRGAERFSDELGSITYAWRRSPGTQLYVGAGAASGSERRREAFVKLQFDLDEAKAIWRE